VRVGYEGPGCHKCEGQARGLGVMDHRGGEARAKGLEPWTKCNGERASEAAIDEPIRPREDIKWISYHLWNQAKC
jgi:hypothetical protein